jgi:hypothetical protein
VAISKEMREWFDRRDRAVSASRSGMRALVGLIQDAGRELGIEPKLLYEGKPVELKPARLFSLAKAENHWIADFGGTAIEIRMQGMQGGSCRVMSCGAVASTIDSGELASRSGRRLFRSIVDAVRMKANQS